MCIYMHTSGIKILMDVEFNLYLFSPSGRICELYFSRALLGMACVICGDSLLRGGSR